VSILAQHFHPIRLGEAGLGAGEADWERAVAGAAAEAGQVEGVVTNVTSAPRRARAHAMSSIGPAWPAAIIGSRTKCGFVGAGDASGSTKFCWVLWSMCDGKLCVRCSRKLRAESAECCKRGRPDSCYDVTSIQEITHYR